MQNQEKHRGFVKLFSLIFVLVFIGGGIFMLSSDRFEKEPPKISYKNPAIWNLKDSFFVGFADNSGIKKYNIYLNDNGNEIPLELVREDITKCDIPANINNVCVSFKKPQQVKSNSVSLELEVVVSDNSKWNFFSGNTTKQNITINVDTKNPKVAVISNSYKITQGGSALVIFGATDDNLDSIKIVNGEYVFKPQPFYKDGFYISLVAWDKGESTFDGKIEVKDKAGNISIVPINFYLQKRQYRDSTIPLTDSFIDGRITSLAKEIGERDINEFVNKVSLFKYINEEVRDYSFNRIYEVSSMYDRDSVINDFKIKPFAPLKNPAVMASFGDSRSFSYQGEIVSKSNHMGLDIASIKQAPVISSNNGVVTLNEFVGIDGNSVVIYHGLGLSTLYAHLTSSNVNVGDLVSSGDIIANTGATGLALGDHLHFSVLIQGYEARTAEWMDKDWIRDNITDIITESKQIIDRL